MGCAWCGGAEVKHPRLPIAALVLSASTLVGIAIHEGYRGDAYIPVPGDVPTIGFGETRGVRMGDRTDPVRALIRLQSSADEYAQAVRRCAPVPMHQHEFDAFVSLTYNIGPNAFCRSTVARRLVVLDYAGACDAILMWNRAGGRVLQGMVKRRQEERRLCLGG